MSCKGRCSCRKPTKKKAIITGITGQDGSHLADLLLDLNYEVIGVVRRSSTDTTQRIKHILGNKNLKIVEGDITDYSSILNILKDNKDACEFYNLAAQSHVAASFKHPEATWDATCKGCFNALRAIVDLDLQQSIRFYQASSSEMFGKNYDEDGYAKYQDEKTKFLPQSPYAIAKCAAHEAVRLYRDAYGLHASAGILFNHEGPRRGEQFVTRKITKWIGNFNRFLHRNNIATKDITKSCLDKNCDIIFASGIQESFPKLRLGNINAYRDWGYAGDYVKAMWLMLQQNRGDDYVICTGESHSIREFLEEAFKCIEISDWHNYIIQDPQFYRPAEVDYLRGKNFKAGSKLKWKPETTFKELVTMMVEHDIKIANEL